MVSHNLCRSFIRSTLVDLVSYTEGATLPLAAFTSAIGLFHSAMLRLPPPWTPNDKPTPLLIYGASSTVGSYAIQLARMSNIHPLVCVAGRARAHVEALIDGAKGDIVLDYRKGDEATKRSIDELLGGRKLEYAFDAISEGNSFQTVANILDVEGRVNFVMPPRHLDWNGKYHHFANSVEQGITSVGALHADPSFKEFASTCSRLFSNMLASGRLRGQPQQIVPEGLAGIQETLEKLKSGQASATKYVLRVRDTPGIDSLQHLDETT
jgi:NADPH:quinone reductase